MYDMQSDFHYYIENQDSLVKKYNGKVIAIRNKIVIGVFDSEGEAVFTLSPKERQGTYLVQRCFPGPESYTVTYHSLNINP